MKDSFLISFIIRTLTLIILFFSLSGTAQQLPRNHMRTPNASNEAKTLDNLCNSSIEWGGRLNESIQTAAATILNNIQKQFPSNQISRCVVLFPDGKPVDETIEEYNRNRIPEDKENTVFLMVAPGVRTILTNPISRDQGLIMVNAGGARHVLPVHWQKSHKVKKTINLEQGQKLVGIPLTTDAKLADNFYIGLERMWESSESAEFKKNSLIDSNATGILIAGLSNAPAFLPSPYEPSPYELKPGEQATESISATSTLLSFQIEPKLDEPDIQPEKNIVNIFNNEVVQPTEQSIAAFVNETFLYSEKTSGKVLFNIKGNHFFSYGQSVTENPVFLTTDMHLNNSEYILKKGSYLELKNNYFFGECKRNIIGQVNNSEKYVAYNNLFKCWINGDNRADLSLKNSFIEGKLWNYDDNNLVTRYISYKNGNAFKGTVLSGFKPLSGSGHSDAKHHRRRFVRETGQRDNEKTDTSHDTQTSNNNQNTVIYISLGIAVFSLGVSAIAMTCNFLNKVKIRSLNDALRRTSAPHVPRAPQFPGWPDGYRYTRVHNFPGGHGCHQGEVYPFYNHPVSVVRQTPLSTKTSLPDPEASTSYREERRESADEIK